MEPATSMPYFSRRLPSTDTPRARTRRGDHAAPPGQRRRRKQVAFQQRPRGQPVGEGVRRQRRRQVDACRQTNPAFQGRGHHQPLASIISQPHQLQRLVQSAQPSRLDHQYVRAVHHGQALQSVRDAQRFVYRHRDCNGASQFSQAVSIVALDRVLYIFDAVLLQPAQPGDGFWQGPLPVGVQAHFDLSTNRLSHR